MALPKDTERKEGELSSEEAAMAKKIFVGFGFLGLSLAITALVSLIPVQYVLPVMMTLGVLAVIRSELRRSPNHEAKF